MDLYFLITLLPIAFAFHNLEETLGMEKWSHTIPAYMHRPVTTIQFGVAVFLFTALGFVVVFARGLYPTERLYYYFIAGFSGMLLLNVLMPHLLATVYFRKYAPGVITGLLINAPLTMFILIRLKALGLLTTQEIVFSGLIGGIIGVELAALFLKIGERLAPLVRNFFTKSL
ncbi:MAG: HXXEE domain-containing protein [Saprospiraceae bacterium]